MRAVRRENEHGVYAERIFTPPTGGKGYSQTKKNPANSNPQSTSGLRDGKPVPYNTQDEELKKIGNLHKTSAAILLNIQIKTLLTKSVNHAIITLTESVNRKEM